MDKLDSISKKIMSSAENFKLQLENLKDFYGYHDKKPKKFIPIKFFNEFLKPLLKKNNKMSIKNLLKYTKKKYNSYNTLSSYLTKLKEIGLIKSTIIKRENYYMLK